MGESEIIYRLQWLSTSIHTVLYHNAFFYEYAKLGRNLKDYEYITLWIHTLRHAHTNEQKLDIMTNCNNLYQHLQCINKYVNFPTNYGVHDGSLD